MKRLILLVVLFIQFRDTTAQLSLQRKDTRLKVRNFLHRHRHRLNVAPLATPLELDKEIQCTSSCLRNEDCVSCNVKRTTNSKFLCELLNTSKYRHPDNLMKDDNYIHWYLQDPCLPNPCNAGTCNNIQSAAEFTCDCPPWSYGVLCYYNSTYNHALRKPTAQSSTYSGSSISSFSPALAVDGSRNGHAGACSGTNHAEPNWWRVDLENEIPVARVAITNRADCCGYRLSDFELKIGDSLVDEGLGNPKCGDRHAVPGDGNTETITCSPPLYGRYLLIHSFYKNALDICEVEVYTGP